MRGSKVEERVPTGAHAAWWTVYVDMALQELQKR